jgi:hypothetical protein
MKIIFLDFDGVLNSTKYFESLVDRSDPMQPKLVLDISDSQNQIDKEAVARLNTVVLQSGAKIVVSSTWRLMRTLDQLKLLLANAGFVGEVIDKTPELKRKNISDPCAGRSVEIAKWLNDHENLNVDKFAILDDSSEAGIGFGDLFVKTKFHSGLQDQHVEKLIEILG